MAEEIKTPKIVCFAERVLIWTFIGDWEEL